MTEATFNPSRDAYIRTHAWLAAFAMAAAMLGLWATGNPHVWTGAIGGLAAIILRGWYMASEELSQAWSLHKTTLTSPRGETVDVAQIDSLRMLGSYVQIITKSGDKHLIKYQASPAATLSILEIAREIAAVKGARPQDASERPDA